MAVVGSYTKQPSELTPTLDIDFSANVPSGGSISSFAVAVTDETGAVKTSEMLQDSQLSSPKVLFRIKAGTDGESYLVTVTATMSDGTIAEAELEIIVHDTGLDDTNLGYLVSEVVTKATTIIGTTKETGQYIEANKLGAVYSALKSILLVKKPENFYEPDKTMRFSGRSAPVPTDFLVWVKLFHPTSYREYKRVSINDFDGLAGHYWTIKKTSLGTQRIYIADDENSLTLRFIKMPSAITTQTQRIKLPLHLVDAHAWLTAAELFRYAQKFVEAEAAEKEGMRLLQISLAVEDNQKEEAEFRVIESVFEGGKDIFAGAE